MSLSSSPRRFLADERGISAIEFALIAPILIAFYLGTVQLTMAITADRKVTSAASVMGDLVTQDEFVTTRELDDIVAAGRAVLQPYPSDGFAVRITSVRMDTDENIYVDWSEGRGMSAYGRDANVDIPDGLLSPNNSIIFVEAEYSYATPFDSLHVGPFALTDKVYLRPRRSLWVRRG